MIQKRIFLDFQLALTIFIYRYSHYFINFIWFVVSLFQYSHLISTRMYARIHCTAGVGYFYHQTKTKRVDRKLSNLLPPQVIDSDEMCNDIASSLDTDSTRLSHSLALDSKCQLTTLRAKSAPRHRAGQIDRENPLNYCSNESEQL